MKPERFAELIGGLIACTSHKMDGRGIEVWRRHLSDIPDDALAAAFGRACAECKAFPSVALIREYAAEAQHGSIDTQGETFARVGEAMRRFGPCLPCVPKCDRCREGVARKHIGELGWAAVRAMGGWSAVCNTDANQLGNLRAQFRDAYRAAAEREKESRALPEHLRPRVDNTPVRPLPTSEGVKLIGSVGFMSVDVAENDDAERESQTRRLREYQAKRA